MGGQGRGFGDILHTGNGKGKGLGGKRAGNGLGMLYCGVHWENWEYNGGPLGEESGCAQAWTGINGNTVRGFWEALGWTGVPWRVIAMRGGV